MLVSKFEVMGIPLPEAERQPSKHPATQALLNLDDTSEGPFRILALGFFDKY